MGKRGLQPTAAVLLPGGPNAQQPQCCPRLRFVVDPGDINVCVVIVILLLDASRDQTTQI